MTDTQFNEKLYTSTEVAQILGVSLRSIYRYLDEGKLQAEIKTATGRHRFTKQNINDFLHPGVQNVESPKPQVSQTSQIPVMRPNIAFNADNNRKVTSNEESEFIKQPIQAKKVESFSKPAESARPEMSAESATKVEEEPIDWLARFRQAAEKYKTQPSSDDTSIESTSRKPSISVVEEEIEEEDEKFTDSFAESSFNYYRSGIGGLKEIAQSLDKSSKNASLEYAFTMNAGLSLHKPIKPFSLIHAYVRNKDKPYFEKVLQLSPSSKEGAQICLIASDESRIFSSKREMHGLFVVSDEQLKLDLVNDGESELAKELS